MLRIIDWVLVSESDFFMFCGSDRDIQDVYINVGSQDLDKDVDGLRIWTWVGTLITLKYLAFFNSVTQICLGSHFFCQFELRHPPMNNVHVGSPRGLATEVAPYGARWLTS